MRLALRPGDSKITNPAREGASGSAWTQGGSASSSYSRGWSAECGLTSRCCRLQGGRSRPDLLVGEGWEAWSSPPLLLRAGVQPPVLCLARSLDNKVPGLAAAASTPLLEDPN